MSWGILLSPSHLSPGAHSRVWNVQVKTKVPDWYQTSRGGNNILHPHPRRPDNPKVGSVPSRQPVAGAVLHTILSAHLAHLHVAAALTSHLSPPPLGSGRGALGVTPKPAPIHHPYPACHPTLPLLLLLFFFSSLFLLPATYPPCICSLTASPPRIASPSITCVNARPGNQLNPSPTSRHHWNAQ